MPTESSTGFNPSQKLPCHYLFGYKPIEMGWFTAQLVYTTPDGYCFNYAEGKTEYIAKIDDIEKDRVENNGRWFGHLTRAENLGMHTPTSEKLYASLGIEIFQSIVELEAELPPDCGYNFARYMNTALPIVHPWGRARIDLKPDIDSLHDYLLHELVRFSVDMLREEGISRCHRAAKLAWAIEPSHREAWALVLRTADDAEVANLKEDVMLLHKRSSDEPDDPELFSELESLVDQLLYD